MRHYPNSILFILCFFYFFSPSLHGQELLWGKSIGSTGQDYFGKLISDSKKNIIHVAAFNEDSVYLSKVNGANGETLWTKFIEVCANRILDMVVDKEDNIYYCGNYKTIGTATQGTFAITHNRILKINGNTGEVIWARDLAQRPTGFNVDAEGNLIMMLFDLNNSVTNPVASFYISKTNSDSGEEIWKVRTEGAGYSNGNVVIDNEGSSYFGSYFNTQAGVGTYTLNNSYKDQPALFYAKVDAIGHVCWVVKIEGYQRDLWHTIDDKGNLYTHGGFTIGTTTISALNTTLTVGSTNYEEGYIIKTDTRSGAIDWAKTYHAGIIGKDELGNIFCISAANASGTNYLNQLDPYNCVMDQNTYINNMSPVNYYNSLMLDRERNIFASLTYTGTIKVGNFSASSKGNRDLFIGKFRGPDATVFENCGKQNLELTPNPVKDNFLLRINKVDLSPYAFEIVDMFGKTFLRFEDFRTTQYINVSELLQGIYCIVVIEKDSGKRMAIKMVKE